jgi:hypothetical protein
MTRETEDYLSDFSEGIEDLKDIKKTLYDNLSGVKVRVNNKDSDLSSSIDHVFGDRSNDPNKDFITFDMFMECLKIVRAGSKAKASEIINKST